MFRDLQSIYNTDYALWLCKNIDSIKRKEYQHIDWENLVEELETLGKSQKRELRSRLSTLLEHCLKLCYTDYEQDFRGWRITIKRTQLELLNLLEESPSLKAIWQESLQLAYQEALAVLTDSSDYQNYIFPKECPFLTAIDILLETNFTEIFQK